MDWTISSFAQLTFTGTQRIADIVELGFIGKCSYPSDNDEKMETEPAFDDYLIVHSGKIFVDYKLKMNA